MPLIGRALQTPARSVMMSVSIGLCRILKPGWLVEYQCNDCFGAVITSNPDDGDRVRTPATENAGGGPGCKILQRQKENDIRFGGIDPGGLKADSGRIADAETASLKRKMHRCKCDLRRRRKRRNSRPNFMT